MEYSSREQPVDFSSCSRALRGVDFPTNIQQHFDSSEQYMFFSHILRQEDAGHMLSWGLKCQTELNSLLSAQSESHFPPLNRCERVRAWWIDGHPAGVFPRLTLALLLYEQYLFHLHTYPQTSNMLLKFCFSLFSVLLLVIHVTNPTELRCNVAPLSVSVFRFISKVGEA